MATTDQCPVGGPRCHPSLCDCFIEQFPDDPLGLHPELFVVMVPCPACGHVGMVGGNRCPVCDPEVPDGAA